MTSRLCSTASIICTFVRLFVRLLVGNCVRVHVSEFSILYRLFPVVLLFFVLLILYYYFIIRCGVCCCSCCSLSSVFFVLLKCSRISIVASSFVDLDSSTYLFVWFYFGSFFSTSNQIHKLTRTHTHTHSHKNRLNFHLIANVFVSHSIRINRRFAAGSIHSFAFECVGFCNVSLSPFCLKLEFLR